jgi:glutamate/tyrosine decarboxylase-like PLP-dependent enzyme
MLDAVFRHADAYLAGLDERPVGVPVAPEVLRARLAGPLPETGVAAERVLDELVAGVDPGLVASAGPRYFGFVTGQALPAARAADMLAAVWDQNAFTYVSSPAAAVVEEIAAG